MKLKNLEVVLFIVSLPFLWIVWHVCPRHRRYFWSDMKELALLSLLCIFLAGCAGPQLRLGAPQAVSVPDKAGVKHPFTYVPVNSGNSFLDHTMGFSLYDEDAKHVLTQTTPNAGLLETLGGAAMQSIVPVSGLVGPLLK